MTWAKGEVRGGGMAASKFVSQVTGLEHGSALDSMTTLDKCVCALNSTACLPAGSWRTG